jgi:hypothetical protein
MSAAGTLINRSQIAREAQELTLLFPSGTTITRDELATWDALEPQALLARLKASFDPWWAFPKLTPAQIDIFRSVIHPEVVIRASDTDLAVLDPRQERNARALGDGHRIVYGVAGSGKTVLLTARRTAPSASACLPDCEAARACAGATTPY